MSSNNKDCVISLRTDFPFYEWFLKRAEFLGLPLSTFLRSILQSYKRRVENGNEKTSCVDFV